jgi:hypothetical protein
MLYEFQQLISLEICMRGRSCLCETGNTGEKKVLVYFHINVISNLLEGSSFGGRKKLSEPKLNIATALTDVSLKYEYMKVTF